MANFSFFTVILTWFWKIGFNFALPRVSTQLGHCLLTSFWMSAGSLGTLINWLTWKISVSSKIFLRLLFFSSIWPSIWIFLRFQFFFDLTQITHPHLSFSWMVYNILGTDTLIDILGCPYLSSTTLETLAICPIFIIFCCLEICKIIFTRGVIIFRLW
jgi:hypothetical protein